jgi:hypothetical protein
MRKSLWIIALLLAATCAPNALADSFDATFTCASSCASVPTDPLVTFPSPTVPVSFFSENFNITLNQWDAPTDTFTWQIGTISSSWFFEIDDLNTGKHDTGPSFSFGQGNPAPWGSGNVNFDCVYVPEPTSIALLLLGLATVFVAHRRLRHGLVQAN